MGGGAPGDTQPLQVQGLLVKVGLNDQAYVNFKPVSEKQLAAAVGEINRVGGFITYYRESPERKCTDEALNTFKALAELRPRIRLGSQAPSEWGRLDWVEVEEAPQVSRFFLARGKKFLISPRAAELNPRAQVLVGGPLATELENACFRRIDLLLRCDRILETPVQQVELAMQDSTRREPSLHLRIGYDRVRWASCYSIAAVPSHVATFVGDLWLLAQRMVDKAVTRQISPEQAGKFFDDSAA